MSFDAPLMIPPEPKYLSRGKLILVPVHINGNLDEISSYVPTVAVMVTFETHWREENCTTPTEFPVISTSPVTLFRPSNTIEALPELLLSETRESIVKFPWKFTTAPCTNWFCWIRRPGDPIVDRPLETTFDRPELPNMETPPSTDETARLRVELELIELLSKNCPVISDAATCIIVESVQYSIILSQKLIIKYSISFAFEDIQMIQDFLL